MAAIRQDKDRGGKFLLGHNTGSLLKLAGIAGFTDCRTVQPESVAPRRLPDGLLEVTFPDRAQPDLFLIEIETYPENASANQLSDDISLVAVERGIVPDAIMFVLHPKGKVEAPRQQIRASRHKTVSLATQWRMVELWTLNATDLFAMNDVGLVPWVPLTHFDGSPEELVQQCRERIDEQAPPRDHDALLMVTEIMTRLAFPNNRQLLNSLIGERSMIRIESPAIAEWEALFEQRGAQKIIISILKSRFGVVPDDLAASLRKVFNDQQLDELGQYAGTCPDLEAFRLRLSASLT